MVRVEADLVDVGGAEAPSGTSSSSAPAAPRGRGSTASAAASRRSCRASSGRRRAGSATPTGTRRCPFSSKNAWNPSRSSAVVRTAAIVGGRLRGPPPSVVASDRAAGRSDAGRTSAPQTPLPHRQGPVWCARRAGRRGRGRLVRPARSAASRGIAAVRRANRRRRPRRGPRHRPIPPRRSRPGASSYGTPLLAGAHVRVRAPAAILVDARDRPRPLGAAPARAPEDRVADEDHDRDARAARGAVADMVTVDKLGHARAARARGAARRRAGQGVEALLRAAPLLRERRRAPARDLERAARCTRSSAR